MVEEIESLVARAQEGDLSAFDEIVRRFQDMAVGYAFSVLGDAHLAEDAAQEAFLSAWRYLAQLDHPPAFPVWFRAVLRTQCGRLTRRRHLPLLPLEAVIHRASGNPSPQDLVETGEMREGVHSALAALPEPEREPTVLYYMGGSSVREIAAFLDLPPSTVKNRLHTARKRLRERLSPMAEGIEERLRDQRPSRDGRFAAEVLAEVVAEYRRQRQKDPVMADRSLLQEGREQLEVHLAQHPIEPGMIRAARALFGEMGDPAAMVDLLARYRSGPLPIPEEAWSRWHEANLLAGAGRCEDVVALQRDLYSWAKACPAGSLRIASDSPFLPLDDPGAEDRDPLAPESVSLWTMGNGTMAQCWKNAGRADEWLHLFQSIMEEAPKTPRNRFRRFNMLRTGVAMLGWLNRPGEAREITERIAALAEEEETWEEAQRWQIEALYLRACIGSSTGDFEEARSAGLEAIARIEELERRLSPLTDEQEGRLRSYCHNVGSPLVGARHYDLALPLFQRVVRDGRGSEWAYLRLAACLWAAGGDRDEARAMLKQAACRHAGGKLLEEIIALPEFAPFVHDPEFRTSLIL